MKIISVLMIVLSICIKSAAIEVSSENIINIRLVHDNKAERQGREIILKFLKELDLKRNIFTKDIVIESKVIPHSHPVLTLNTRQVDDPNMYLATFIHEQIHWFFEPKKKETEKFIELMKESFSNPPSNKNAGGARDLESTYLHLGVCYYEFKELIRLLGSDEAKRIFKSSDVYTWIREQVLNKSYEIEKALKKSGLDW